MLSLQLHWISRKLLTGIHRQLMHAGHLPKRKNSQPVVPLQLTALMAFLRLRYQGIVAAYTLVL